MSSLTDSEKRYLEKIFDMQNGYVLDYTDPKFRSLFRKHGIDIDSPKYQIDGTSKAKKMRSFWDCENDAVVGRVLSEMLEAYKVSCELNDWEFNSDLYEKCGLIVERLTGQPVAVTPIETVDPFLNHEFTFPDVSKLPVDASVVSIIQDRLNEAQVALQAGAHLSVIFLCGSVLEAVLLGSAQKEPARFNQSTASPKNKEGNVKQLHEWSLAQFIDVASNIGLITPDVQKFSHGLRDFRNYIHPHEQMQSGFNPNADTAKICLQVLKAALSCVAGGR
ncbi:MAG: hypothetical protein HQM06_16225 [Magnetococcales bacterium]|nr:hypothetical protein [Magnetococcales bacterium]